MKVDVSAIVDATEANQDFSKVARFAEGKGRVIVFKNSRPNDVFLRISVFSPAFPLLFWEG